MFISLRSIELSRFVYSLLPSPTHDSIALQYDFEFYYAPFNKHLHAVYLFLPFFLSTPYTHAVSVYANTYEDVTDRSYYIHSAVLDTQIYLHRTFNKRMNFFI